MIKTFEFLINTGIKSIEGIVDSKEKAIVCAELAKAIAMSGVLRGTEVEAEETTPVVEEKKETKKKGAGKKASSKKEALKTENQKEETVTPIAETPVAEAEVVEEAPQVPQEPIAEEPVATPAPAEVEIVDEWTEEMLTLKAEQLGILNAYVEAWGDTYVYNDCLGCFSENAFTGAENVRPSNIDGFVVYLNELAQQFAQQ